MGEVNGMFVDGALSALRSCGCFREDGKLNETGLHVLKEMLEHSMPEDHGVASDIIKRTAGSMIVIACVLVQDGRAALKWCDHPASGMGWHVARTLPRSRQGESFEDAVRRCGREKLGYEVRLAEKDAILGVIDDKNNPRFSEGPILYICERVSGEPRNLVSDVRLARHGSVHWFAHCPQDLLPVQAKYRPYIEQAIEWSRDN